MIKAVRRALRHRPGGDRGLHHGPGLPERRVAGHRSHGRAARRAADRGARHCSSTAAAAPASQAICFAAMEVQTGTADVVLAGGVESMSNVEHYATGLRTGGRGTITLYDRLDRGRITAGSANYLIEGGMLETAENLRTQVRASPRSEQDEYSLRSHQRAVAAWDAGKFDDEIVPVTVTTRAGRDRGRPRRAPARRHDASSAWRRCVPVTRPPGPRGHRHGGQRQRRERRRRLLHRHDAGAGRRAGPEADGEVPRLGRRRRAPGVHGHRPGAGDEEAARPPRPAR